MSLITTKQGEQFLKDAAAKTASSRPSLFMRSAHDLLGVLGAGAVIYAAVRFAHHLHLLH